MEKNYRNNRLVLTVITICCILFIFHNSMFPGPQSSNQSQYVMTLLNHILGTFGLPVTLSEHFVRKLAHFIEYFVLGILMTATIKSYGRPVIESVFTVLFFLLLIPVADELIQFFTPQRGSSVLDVLLDFSGGITGMLLCYISCYCKRQKA